MPDATHDALRKQVARAIYKTPGYISTDVEAAADAVLAMVVERERVLRERIEDCRWPRPSEPNSRVADDTHGWRAWRSHEKAIDAALAVLDE